jgi:hypothetical protein
LFNGDNRLCGWINEKTGETKPVKFTDILAFNKLAFAGIQMLSPLVFELMDSLPSKFPIMDFYLSNAQTQRINGFIPDNFHMLDVGKLNVLDEAELFVNY